MSLPWSSKGLKATPIAADELLIIDSADANPATQNKRITIGTLPASETFTWTADHDAAGFDLLNVGEIQINNPADTFQYILTPAAIAADRILNLPLLTGTDTLVTEAFAQILTNKTIDGSLNTLSNLVIGSEVTGASTALTDTASIAYLNTANAYTAGTRQDFLGLLAGTSGLNVGGIAGNPTSQVDGDLWLNTSSNILFARINGVDVNISAAGEVFTWTANHDAAGFNLITMGILSFDDVNTSLQQATADLQLDLATGGAIVHRVNNIAEYDFDAADADFLANNLRNFGFIESNATTPATAEAARFGNNEHIAWRNSGNTANARLGLTTGDDLQLDQADFEINAANDEAVNFRLISNYQTPANGQNLVNIAFRGDNDAPDTFNFAEIDVHIRDVTEGSEVGEIRFIAANQDTGPGDALLSINELGVTGVHILNGPLYFTSSSTFPDDDVIIFNNGGGMNLNVADTGFDFVIGTTFEYFFGPTAADWSANDLTGMGTLEFTSDTGHQISDSATQLLIDTNTGDDILFRQVTTELFKINEAEGLVASRRIQGLKGADVVAATTITLVDGNFFDITGATQIDAIVSTNWQAGSTIVLHFDSTPIVGNNIGTDGIILAGGAFTATADDTLTLIWNGTRWEELSRSLN